MNHPHKSVAHRESSSGRDDRTPWFEALVLLLVGALLSFDLASDIEAGRAKIHYALELGAACVAVAGLGWICADWWRVRRRLGRKVDELTRQLESAREEGRLRRREHRAPPATP